MSFRDRPADTDSMRSWMRNVEDTLARLEKGLGLVAPLSLPSRVSIGDVDIETVQTTGNGRAVIFTNSLTGATYTITL